MGVLIFLEKSAVVLFDFKYDVQKPISFLTSFLWNVQKPNVFLIWFYTIFIKCMKT